MVTGIFVFPAISPIFYYLVMVLLARLATIPAFHLPSTGKSTVTILSPSCWVYIYSESFSMGFCSRVLVLLNNLGKFMSILRGAFFLFCRKECFADCNRISNILYTCFGGYRKHNSFSYKSDWSSHEFLLLNAQRSNTHIYKYFSELPNNSF